MSIKHTEMPENQMFHVEHSPFGVYVHVPFCLSKCGYCDFCRVTDLSLVDDYVRVVEDEMMRSSVAGLKPRSVYVGGGTPSCIGVERVGKLLGIVGRTFDLSELAEFTVECNPEDVDGWLAETLVTHGVNRVSMGAQSLNDEMLKMLGRRHSSAKVREAVRMLRSAGIGNMSVDCIFGLPALEGFDTEADFDEFLSLGVEHLSAYALSYEEGSRFSKMVREGRLVPLDDDIVAEQYAVLTAKMKEAGYGHYEISNYAKRGREAVHNSSYWERVPYYGFGPGASSFYDGVRTTNVMDVRRYVKTDGREKSLVEELSEEQVFEEVVMLGLRTARGIDVSEFAEPYRSRFLKNAEREIENGNLKVAENERMVIPEERWFVADGIIDRLVL